ncbi:hypothetical protein [Micromonospora lupini]|uniref:hypothetical protein n=1 Tax=Micromonospora lupini TaxID=285679 RepID=UPI00337835AF
MSETGQPGAATPGEHGDGTGQHDDPGRPGSGWAPSTGGWSPSAEREPAGEQAPPWQQPLASGWRTSSTRHGDLPAPLPGLTGDSERQARVNGHTNGVHHDEAEIDSDSDSNGDSEINGVRHGDAEINGVAYLGGGASPGRQTPVSAPPGRTVEDRPDAGAGRLVVPAQRPAPAVEQGPDEADPGPSRHSTTDPAAPRSVRWADPALPGTAPASIQVPPVGTAASGFEVPPGLRAPTGERSAVDDQPAVSHGWRAPLAAEASAESGRGDDSEPEHPTGDTHRAGEPPSIEPDWSGPSWNRPSWGSGWAPPWSRQDGEPAGRPARDESTPGWVAEPNLPYEPVRAEPTRPYEPVPAEPPRAYDITRDAPQAEADAGRGTPPRPSWAGERPATTPTSGPPEVSRPEPAERPSWAGGPTPEPASGLPADRPSWAAPAPISAPADPSPRTGGTDPTPTSGPPVPPRSASPAAERPSWAGGPAPTSGPPAVDRPSWVGAASGSAARAEPTSGPPAVERPSWAGAASSSAEPTSGPPAVERPSWAGGSDPTPASAPPSRPSWAGPASALPPPPRPSWAGGSDPVPTSAPPSRPSWAGDPTPAGAPAGTRPSWAGPAAVDPPAPVDSPPPAPAGPPPTLTDAPPPAAPVRPVAERPAWVGGSPTPVAAERPDWSEGRIPAAPAERPSWPATRPATSPRASDAGESTGPVRPTAPFRLRPATPEPPTPAEPTPAAPTATGPSFAGPPPPSAGAGPASATSGPGRHDRPSPASAPPYAARRSAPDPASPAEPADGGRRPDTSAVLPQRVPAEPDVPVVPEPPAVEPPAETPELARIATHVRRDDEPAPLRERPEGFDVNAILDAVREVAGVRDAALRRTPAGAHSLRLDLADGADPAEVSRQVARLLQERMGLAAAPQNVPGLPTTPAPPVRRRAAEPRPAAPRPVEPRVVEPRSAEPRVAERRPAEPRVAESRPAEPGDTGAETRIAEATPTGPEQWVGPDAARRRRAGAPHRGRATVEEPGSVSAAPTGGATGSPATVGTSYSGGQVTTTESAPSRPLETGGVPGPRVVIDHVQVSTFGLDANVEVRLLAGDDNAAGYATGPAVDGYVLRLCAVAAAAAVDELLRGAENAERGRCFVEHAAVVPFGNCEVATVVVLLVCEGWVEQLAGSALVAGDPRQAVVRATLAAVNRRLEALLS